MKIKKRIVLLALVLPAVLFQSSAQVVEEIVAVVNDDIITLSQYRERHEVLYQMLRAQLQGEQFDKVYPKQRDELINGMITELLLLQAAREKQLSVGDQVKSYIENIKKENNMSTDEELKRELLKQGMSFEEWRKQLEESVMRDAVIFSEVDRTIVIDDAEIVNYYKLNPGEFIEPEEVKLKAIYLAFEQRDEEEQAGLMKEAEERLKAGEDFAEVAGRYSDEPLKTSGGDLGSFKKGELEKTLEDVAAGLAAGGVSSWVKARNGWYLLRLEDRKESRLKTFDEVKQEIQEKLFMDKKLKKLNEFIKKLREKSYIKILKPNPLDR